MTANIAALEANARAGDLAAQFDLAVALDRAGRRADATVWMERAADGGHGEALVILAQAELQGTETPRNGARAHERLKRAVASGGNSARRALATLTATGEFAAPDWPAAIALLIDAAKAGDWIAVRELGLLLEMAAPRSPLAGELLLRAGLQGDGFAAFAVMRRQALHGRTLATERVFEQWRAGIQRIGHPLANKIANVTANPDAHPTRPSPDVDWSGVAAQLAAPPGLGFRRPFAVSEQPYVRRFDGLLTAEESEYVIASSARMLVPASVRDKASGEGKQSDVRTNSVAVFWPFHQDMVIHAINLRLAAAAGLPPANGELLNVLMYRPGEEYRAHFDFFPLEIAKADASGQRIRTLLVYLNTDYEAGETHFITANIKFKGDVGDGLLFHNCDEANAPDRTTLHAGLPVTRGQKWLISKWFREKTFVV